MTHHDYQYSRQVQSRWQKEQQLIRRKYQIPYNITYTSKPCHSKPLSIPSKAESLFKHDNIIVTDKDIKRKPDQHYFDTKNNDFHIPPMYCSKCHSNLTDCLCEDGIGQWWIHLNKQSDSTDKILKKKSHSNSIPERHVSFDNSLIDLSSIGQINPSKTKPTSHQYVLLDWHNRQSLLNFIQTTELTKNPSNMSIEQLQQLITHDNHIHIFNSITDLILTMNKEQHRISLCYIYIDRLYYSNFPDNIPLSRSHLIADNINLNRMLYNIQKLAILLGVKIDHPINKFLPSRISTKQRKSILNQHLLFLASKLPSNTFRHTSVHTQ